MVDVTTGNELRTHEEPKRRRWSRRRILVWSIGVIVIGGMVIAVLLPSLCRPRETANRIKCASNLRQMGQAISLYAKANGGRYPSSLAVLVAHGDITPSLLVCPSSSDVQASAANTAGAAAEIDAAEKNAPGHQYCLSYIYIGGHLNAVTVSKTTVVAYEPLANHDGDGANVLFGDGDVQWIGKQSWPKIAASIGHQSTPSSGSGMP